MRQNFVARDSLGGAYSRFYGALTRKDRTNALARLAHLFGSFEIDRYELRDAALHHGDAEQAVHARHCKGMMGDDEEAGLGAFAHRIEQIAEAFDIVVVERRVDLVEHADGRGI